MAESVPQSVLTKEAVQSLKVDWLDNCLINHKSCPSISVPPHDDLPSRLIRVERLKNGLIQARLINTRQPEFQHEGLRYLTLSHAWGIGTFLILKKSNVAQFYNKLPLLHADFNKTFKEAITLTALLGYRYIWIDSLCIIQDSDFGLDWSAECPRMGTIFENSDLTLAASGFRHGLDGMLVSAATRQTLVPPIIQASDGTSYLVISKDTSQYPLPLEKRGWVLQETLLVRTCDP